MSAEALQKTVMALARDQSNDTQKLTRWQNGKKTHTNQGHRLQATTREVGVCWLNSFVQTLHQLLNLSADAAHEPICKRWHVAQNDHRSGFGLPIGLWQPSESDIGLPHRLSLTSARVYSGSWSPYARARLWAANAVHSIRSRLK